MEFDNVKNAMASGKNCIGCVRHKKDVMITIHAEDGEIHDAFLTQAQAENLLEQLTDVVLENKY